MMRSVVLVGVLAIGCAAASQPEPQTAAETPPISSPQVVPPGSVYCPPKTATALLADAPAMFAFRDGMAPDDGRRHFLPRSGFVDPRHEVVTFWGVGEQGLAAWTRNVDEIVGDTQEDGDWLLALPTCVPNHDAHLRTNDFDDMREEKLAISSVLRDRATAMLVDQAPESVRAAFAKRTAKRGGIEPAAFRVLATNFPSCARVVAMMADLGGMDHLGGVLCFEIDDTVGDWLVAPTIGLDPHVVAAADLDGDGIEEIVIEEMFWEDSAVVRSETRAFVADEGGNVTTIAMVTNDHRSESARRSRLAGLRLGTVEVPKHVDAAPVTAVLDARLDAMAGCFGRAKVDDPGLEGELRVRAKVDRRGAITDASVDGGIATPRLQRCVGLAMGRVMLPSAAKAYALSVTIAFEP